MSMNCLNVWMCFIKQHSFVMGEYCFISTIVGLNVRRKQFAQRSCSIFLFSFNLTKTILHDLAKRELHTHTPTPPPPHTHTHTHTHPPPPLKILICVGMQVVLLFKRRGNITLNLTNYSIRKNWFGRQSQRCPVCVCARARVRVCMCVCACVCVEHRLGISEFSEWMTSWPSYIIIAWEMSN